MKKYSILVVLLVIGVIAWGSWEFHFWTAPGRTFHVGSWKFLGFEFQVWQRKNKALTEPFITAMFVRDQTNEVWQAFSIGHQDLYAPRIRLREMDSKVQVLRGSKLLGIF